ncbi:MAG: hypothetical protein K6G49_00990 [Candidatus Saccharibacteria bacterium]|nr:hypothetical protein [Candidatus Saccharibacteria bacterium]
MDNQPTQPGGINASQPSANSGPNINPNLGPNAQESVNAVPTPPTGLPATDNVVFEPVKKKRKKGPLLAIICVLVALLIGGGAFAAAYFINNQPANILASAFNNLLNAKQTEVSGSINLALQNSEEFGVESISLNFDDKYSGLSNNTTATLNVNFADGTSAPAIDFGEVMLNDGVLYLEASGLSDFYDGAFRDNLKATLMNQFLPGDQTIAPVDPAIETATSQAVDEILEQIGKIISSIDGQWIEISIDDILDSEMLATIPADTRNNISGTYKCTANVLSQPANYSGEFSELYSQNPFINMTAGADSFYNISFDAAKFANYLNAAPSTKLAKDLATCYGTNIADDSVAISAENIEAALGYFPQFSAKFDGFFDHHLTELKITGQNDLYILTSDLKFTYPDNVTITAPTDSRPVMDVVEEVYQGLQAIQIFQ